jgi:hypothetical protein
MSLASGIFRGAFKSLALQSQLICFYFSVGYCFFNLIQSLEWLQKSPSLARVAENNLMRAQLFCCSFTVRLINLVSISWHFME